MTSPQHTHTTCPLLFQAVQVTANLHRKKPELCSVAFSLQVQGSREKRLIDNRAEEGLGDRPNDQRISRLLGALKAWIAVQSHLLQPQKQCPIKPNGCLKPEKVWETRELSSPGLGGDMVARARVGRQASPPQGASSQHWHLWKAGSEGRGGTRTLSPGFFFSPTPIPRALIRGGSKALVPCNLPGGLPGNWSAD